MSLESTSVLINDTLNHIQGIVDAANKIASTFMLAAEKQNNEHFNRVLYLDAQKHLQQTIKLEDDLYEYADLLRSVAGLSLSDGEYTNGQLGRTGTVRRED
jgi:hypothetical protein